MSEETAIFNLELNVEQALSEVRRLETLVVRTLGLVKRFGLPEDINSAISLIQRMTMTIRILHTAMIALQVASGPIGWALAAVGITAAAITAYDVAYEMGSK